MAVVELSQDPGGSYLRAARGLFVKSHQDHLPDVELVRRDVTVDRAHLAAYDRVCGFRLTDALPPTYPHVLAFGMAMRLMSAPGFPLPVVGLVHIANRITTARPIGAGERLGLSVKAADLREHDRGRQFDVIATATAGDGAEVWRGVSTYLRKERPGQKRERTAAESGGSARWRIPASTGGAYAAVSGDRNPIHTSRLGARAFGFGRPIAHGMWSKARCLAALEGRLPESYTVDVTFQQPIPLPSSIWFGAARRDDGWEFDLHGKRPHLAGQVTPP